ncbi:MbcA/ParS/Xre antitoxin family protein [Undibacterium oligocarboniphilum]|nr:MbcA/ParS/Xre antitoxin family protein [Undibacterium oligocarboniphilum]
MKKLPLNDQQKSKQLSVAGIKAFFNIAAAWKLNNAEEMILLGWPGRTNFYNWKKDPTSARLSRDTLERISYILGIYKALQILLPDATAADAWVSQPNEEVIFGGRPAIARMLSGNVADLYVVRQYLDAMRGGWS